MKKFISKIKNKVKRVVDNYKKNQARKRKLREMKNRDPHGGEGNIYPLW